MNYSTQGLAVECNKWKRETLRWSSRALQKLGKELFLWFGLLLCGVALLLVSDGKAGSENPVYGEYQILTKPAPDQNPGTPERTEPPEFQEDGKRHGGEPGHTVALVPPLSLMLTLVSLVLIDRACSR